MALSKPLNNEFNLEKSMEKLSLPIADQATKEMEEEETLQFKDLPAEMKLTILETLKLPSLVHMSRANLVLFKLARRVFKLDHSQYQVRLEEEINVEFTKLLLKSFGDLLTDLYFDRNHEVAIIDYLETHWERNELPFSNIKTLNFYNNKLDKRFTRFNDFFPNLENLHLIGTNVMDPKCIEVHMPTVKKFSISNYPRTVYPDEVYNPFGMDNIKAVIRLNPQFRYISLHEDHLIKLDGEMLQFVKENLPNVEEINIHIEMVEDNVRGINFESVKKATFCVSDGKELLKTDIRLDNMEQLILVSRDYLTMKTLEFAEKYPHLKYLKVHTDYCGLLLITPSIFEKFAGKMPCLEEMFMDIQVNARMPSPLGKHIAQFLHGSKQLKIIYFRFVPNQLDHEFNKQLPDKLENDIKTSGIEKEWTWGSWENDYKLDVNSTDIYFKRKIK